MIKVLDKPYLDLTTPIGRGFIAFLSAMAEDERHRIVKRANEGRAAARKRGVHMGRKPKLTDHQRQVVRDHLAAGESARAIARKMGCRTYHDILCALGSLGYRREDLPRCALVGCARAPISRGGVRT
jgi:DNA invertase Pin-like site-specific DNA recombinase